MTMSKMRQMQQSEKGLAGLEQDVKKRRTDFAKITIRKKPFSPEKTKAASG